MEDVLIEHLRLATTPASPGGRDGWGFRVDVFEIAHTGAEHVTLDIEVSDSTRASLPVNDSGMGILVEEGIRKLINARVERVGAPALEQIRAWPRPIVLSRDHFPDSL
jgi:hypothetical protein